MEKILAVRDCLKTILSGCRECKALPTAKTFLQNLIEENNQDSNIDLEDALIEFAKLHVEQALKEASEKARVQMGESYMREQITIHPHSLVDTVIITADAESILNSYSLDNIK